MALTLSALKLLAPHLKGAKILCLGYPDLLVTADEYQEVFGFLPERFTRRGAWHGRQHPLPETEELLTRLASTLQCVDICSDFGIEKIVDLNHKVDLGNFDLVIDPGTIEHCFNIGQAVFNAADAVKVGGRIFHIPPMSLMNHGFYNICPTMLFDFYTQNGWKVEALKGMDRDGNEYRISETGRFKSPPEVSLHCLAKRETHGPLRMPIQTKYIRKMEKAA